MIPIMTDRGSHCKHQRGERKKMDKNCVFVHCQWRVLCTAVIGPCISVLAPGVYGSPPLQLRSPPSLCLLHLFSFPHLFPLWPRSERVRIHALKACVRVRVCKMFCYCSKQLPPAQKKQTINDDQSEGLLIIEKKKDLKQSVQANLQFESCMKRILS